MSENEKPAYTPIATPGNTTSTNGPTKPAADQKDNTTSKTETPTDKKDETKEVPDAAQTIAKAGTENNGQQGAK